jgi:hypothetical protein
MASKASKASKKKASAKATSRNAKKDNVRAG